MGKLYGYARCSTNEVKQDIERQKAELRQLGVDDRHMYFEYITSKADIRIELFKVLDLVQEGDTIISTELSRITRNVKELCEIIEFAKNKKIILHLGNFHFDCSKDLDAMQEGMLKMMAVFAELERNMTSERVKSGLQNAKRKGKVLGRRKVTYKDIPSDVKRMYRLYTIGEINKSKYAKACGISRPTLDKYLRLIEEHQKNKNG